MLQKYFLTFATLFTIGELQLSEAQRITTIQLDGIQYFISRMNPYTPELNYFMAYQYCRSIGLQLSSFESKEKSESITQYLTNAGYNKYDFWTSGNRIGTDMFLWMSTGLPFNATFNLMKSQEENQPLLGTMPLGRKKRLDSGISDACVALKSPDLIWDTEDCTSVKDFICEQTRCYYYNYGSIPVSSSQGNKTNSNKSIYSTPLPLISSSLSTTTISSILSTSTYFNNNNNNEEENYNNGGGVGGGASGGDDYYNENNYVRILNNYRKVNDEEEVDGEEQLNDETANENEGHDNKIKIKTTTNEKIDDVVKNVGIQNEKKKDDLQQNKEKVAKENDKHIKIEKPTTTTTNVNRKILDTTEKEISKKTSDKDESNKKSNENIKSVQNNRMDIKETIMKNIQNKINDKQVGVNKNVYKKNASTVGVDLKKTSDEIVKKNEKNNGNENVQTTTTTTTTSTVGQPKHSIENDKVTKNIEKLNSEHSKKVEDINVDINENNKFVQTKIEQKGDDHKQIENKINIHQNKELINKDASNMKTSEIINNIKNIMNHSNKLSNSNSEIHDTQIIIKSGGGAANFETDETIVGNVKKIEEKTLLDTQTTQQTDIIVDNNQDKFNPFTIVQHGDESKNQFGRNGSSGGGGDDDKTRLRNTKVFEPTENDARHMPENLSNAFPWSWAKDILLEKPVAKKTVFGNVDGEVNER